MYSKAIFLKEQYRGFCETPSLVSGDNFGLPTAFETPFISSNDFEEIGEGLQKQHYLGKRMEFFFQHWINSCSNYDLLAHSVQLIENRQTLGELDFLVLQKSTNEIFHIELVYKCYLWDPELSQNLHEALVGPNYKDFFHRKQQKLAEHQFPLINHPMTKQLLKKMFPWINVNKIEQKTCFKAQIFVPENRTPEQAWFNSDCIVGHWYKFEEFKVKNWTTCEFHMPQKFLWPCLLTDVEYMSFEKTLPKIEARLNEKRSPMLWIKNTEGQLQKCFVTL